MNESRKEVWGYVEDKIPARRDLINSFHKHLDSEDNSSFESITENKTDKSPAADRIEKELRLPPGPFQIWLEEGAKARITAANPGSKSAVLVKLAGDAYCSLDLNIRKQREARNNAELQA